MGTRESGLSAIKTRSSGMLDTGVLRPGESLDAVWKHIVEGLEALATNGTTDQTTLNESGLTQRLMDELEGHDGYRPYYFHKEYMEDDSDGHSRRGDVAVLARKGRCVVINGVSHASGAPFLALEAKRLPAPKKEREREYLVGHGGGIERYKRGMHARALKEVGMIGYVQRYSFDYWRKQINSWVDELLASSQQDLSWDVQDRLDIEAVSPLLARLRSNTLRKSDDQRLSIRHLWVQCAVGHHDSISLQQE